MAKENAFFYLDAHWEEDLPLREELNIIFSKWISPIVIIDDFQVPDSDYIFDDYGPGKALNLDHIEPVMSAHKLSAFFPAMNASAETGARSACVVLFQEMLGFEVDTNQDARSRPALAVGMSRDSQYCSGKEKLRSRFSF